MKISECTNCTGSGHVTHERAGESTKCFTCNGFGKSKDGGYGAYKSQAMANRHGKTCHTCKGKGIYVYPDLDRCFSCSFYNPGIVVSEAHEGDILPKEIGRCGNIPKNVAEQLVSEWKFVVVRNDKGLNWGESFLGLGSIYSVTDYGSAWKNSSDESLIEKVKDSLLTSSTQWVSVITENDRKIVSVIGIKLTPNGYSIVSLGSLASIPLLPPTYTNEVLSRPI